MAHFENSRNFDLVAQVGPVMWIEKLAHGVLELDTPIGPRYLQPTFVQRALLMWTFRNFFSLPQQVLRPRERQLIDRLLSESRFVSVPAMGASEWTIIGRIERRAPSAAIAFNSAEVLPARKAAASQSAVAEQGREAASA